MKKTTILITGAAGFVGSNLYNRFKNDARYIVIGVDNFEFGYVKNIDYTNGMEGFIPTDFYNLKYSILSSVDVLVHCATANIIYSIDFPEKVYETNEKKTCELFDNFRFGKKIIYTSTASIYGNADVLPTSENAELRVSNAYDSSKLLAEQHLQKRGNYTTLRLSNVYGVNQRPESLYCGVIGKMVKNALLDLPIQIINGGEQTRDFTYVDDVVDAIILAIEQEAKNTEINIASGIETSIIDIGSALAENANLFPFGVRSNTLVPPRAIDKINRRCLCVEKANYVLNWQPKTSLKEGLKKTIDWQLREYRKEFDSRNLSAGLPTNES